MFTDRDIEFLFEVGSLRNVPRGWRQHLGMDVASDLEHTMRVMWIALMIARKEGVRDEEKIMKMAMVHDLAETRTADHSYVQKMYVKSDEDRATGDTFAKTVFEDIQEVVREFEKRECIEAKIVKDADNLDIQVELKELEEQGSQLATKWLHNRVQQVRNQKLYTQSAKELWDKIDAADPSSWHINHNKWLTMPEEGK